MCADQCKGSGLPVPTAKEEQTIRHHSEQGVNQRKIQTEDEFLFFQRIWFPTRKSQKQILMEPYEIELCWRQLRNILFSVTLGPVVQSLGAPGLHKLRCQELASW